MLHFTLARTDVYITEYKSSGFESLGGYFDTTRIPFCSNVRNERIGTEHEGKVDVLVSKSMTIIYFMDGHEEAATTN